MCVIERCFYCCPAQLPTASSFLRDLDTSLQVFLFFSIAAYASKNQSRSPRA